MIKISFLSANSHSSLLCTSLILCEIFRMSVIFILIACSLFLALTFLVAYAWASKDGQFEDDYTPSVRMLFEDEVSTSSAKESSKTDTNPSMNNTN